MELWRLFRQDISYRAVKECSFVVDKGLWPDFINCTRDESYPDKMEQLFAKESCKVYLDANDPAVVLSKKYICSELVFLFLRSAPFVSFNAVTLICGRFFLSFCRSVQLTVNFRCPINKRLRT